MLKTTVILICIALPALAQAAAPPRWTLQQEYLESYIAFHQAGRSDRTGDTGDALKQYQKTYESLLEIRAENPEWEKGLVEDQIETCRTRIAALTGKPAPVPAAQAPQPIKPASPTTTPPTLPQQYLAIYLKLNDSELAERNGDFQDALSGFKDCFDQLQKIHGEKPAWEPVLITNRLSDVRAKIFELRPMVEKAQSFPTALGTLMTFSIAPEPQSETTQYPWKTNIILTVFWIGENGSASAWNPEWTKQNNGRDNPDEMSGYASSQHASTINPFYVALPFNDLANPKKAAQWIPASWLKPPQQGAPLSACKDHWIEIKGPTGRTCFAQWEDVGPNRSDNAEYVFGSARPDTGNCSGLSVSPAVARYLGIYLHGSALTSWRFVDNADVQPGMWLKYDEQALLFRALNQVASGQK